MSLRPATPTASAVSFQPIVHAETAQPFAYHARSDRPGVAIRAAVSGGFVDGDALLALPIGGGDPAMALADLFRTSVAMRVPAERLVALVSADEYGDAAAIERAIAACEAHGIAVALTDFSAGHIGMRLLARHTPRFVMLDRALVRRIEGSAARRLIVEGVLRLARRTGTMLVAPGIETPAELASLHGIGIRQLQGDWIAPASARIALPNDPCRPAPIAAPRHPAAIAAQRSALDPQHRRLQHHRRLSGGAPADRAMSMPMTA